MANWSDPRATAAPYSDVRAEAYDAGLRAYMLSVYNYMAVGRAADRHHRDGRRQYAA